MSEGLAASQMREIILKDSSIIMAEVVSYEQGIYTLHSESMGELRLHDSAIRSIRVPESTSRGKSEPIAGKSAQPSSKEDIHDVQESVLTNPGLLEMVFALQNDPEVQDIIQDQEIMALITAGDLKKLESNPKFIKLMENPKIRAILSQMSP